MLRVGGVESVEAMWGRWLYSDSESTSIGGKYSDATFRAKSYSLLGKLMLFSCETG